MNDTLLADEEGASHRTDIINSDTTTVKSVQSLIEWVVFGCIPVLEKIQSDGEIWETQFKCVYVRWWSCDADI